MKTQHLFLMVITALLNTAVSAQTWNIWGEKRNTEKRTSGKTEGTSRKTGNYNYNKERIAQNEKLKFGLIMV